MTQVQKKKKKWYPIIAPKEFNNMEIGETLIDDPELPLNRKISISLSNITNDFKKQNMSLIFNLTGVKDNKVQTILDGFELPISYVKRMTRATKAKIEDSFVAKTKDGVNLRIKPILIIKNKVNASIKTKLQRKLREALVREVSKLDYISFISDISSFKIQKEVQKELKPIYPLFSLVIKAIYKETDLKKKAEEIKEVIIESVEDQEGNTEIKETIIEEIQEKIKEEKPVEEVKEHPKEKKEKASKKEKKKKK